MACEPAGKWRRRSEAVYLSKSLNILFVASLCRIDYTARLTRPRAEMMCRKFFKACVAVVQRALENAGVDAAAVGKVSPHLNVGSGCYCSPSRQVYLAGGAAVMPAFTKNVGKCFEDDTTILCSRPGEVHAAGAAVQGQLLAQIDLNDEEKVKLLTADRAGKQSVFRV